MTEISPALKARRPTRLMRVLIGVLVAFALLLLVCLALQTVLIWRDKLLYPPQGRLVEVDGRGMHIVCSGEPRAGSPTIILDIGHPENVSGWVWLQPQLAAAARVCSYDRAGIGWSDSAPEPRTMARMAEELHALLAAAGETAPYLLVGQSWGGAVSRLYARSYPQEVAGLVWIEATHPDAWVRRGQPESTFGGMSPEIINAIPVLARLGLFRFFPDLRGGWGIVPGLPERQQAELTAYFNTNTWADYVVEVERALPESLAALRKAGDVGDTPLLVITGSASGEADEIGAELQRELASLSSRGQFLTIEGADHSSLVHVENYAGETGRAILQFLAVATSSR